MIRAGLVAVMLWGAGVEAAEPIRPAAPCPEHIETLAAGLLRDLPAYANRVAARNIALAEASGFGTVLLVGPPSFEAIDLGERSYDTVPEAEADAEEDPIEQLFFTTLERRYHADGDFEMQGFHWLLLTPDASGWRLVTMFSSFGGYPAGSDTPTPPEESSGGIVGQAVQLWLRDCRAQAVFPVETGE